MSGRRIDVTATQAVASMLAALTGAIAASGLGIGGTILGAAFMSLAGTVGAAVYKHYIARSNERLRAAAANLGPRAGGSAVAAAVIRHQHGGSPAETTPVRHPGRAGAPGPVEHAAPAPANRTARETPAPAPAPSPDATETEVLPALVGLSYGGPDRRDRPREPEPTQDLGSPTGTGASAAQHGAEDVTHTWFRPSAGGPARPADTAPASVPASAVAAGSKTAATGPGARRRWLMVAAATLGVFVIAMGAITAFEAIAGKPLDAVVWHRKGSGTTLGGLVSRHPARHQQSSRPRTGPSPTGSPSSVPPGTTPSNSVSPTATPSASASPGTSPPASSGTGTSSGPATTRAPNGASPAP